MSIAGSLAVGCFAGVLCAWASPAPALAASPTRVDLFGARDYRTSSPLVKGNRIDLLDALNYRTASGCVEVRRRREFFDAKGDRSWYAIIEGKRIDFFDARSKRTGWGRTRAGEIDMCDREWTGTGLAHSR